MSYVCTYGLIPRLWRFKDFDRRVREGNAKIAKKNVSRHKYRCVYEPRRRFFSWYKLKTDL